VDANIWSRCEKERSCWIGEGLEIEEKKVEKIREYVKEKRWKSKRRTITYKV
jgi:hypothetical protein